jgi:hypothetical protein
MTSHMHGRSLDRDRTVEPPGIESTATSSYDYADTMGIILHNADGRDTARDVEVFAYVVSHPTSREWHTDLPVEMEPLVFENPLGSNMSRTVSSVPPGFYRKAWWVVVGEPAEVTKAFVADDKPQVEDMSAAVCIDPYSRQGVPWLSTGRAYVVDLIVTGSNFDAVYFSGVFEGIVERDKDQSMSPTPGRTNRGGCRRSVGSLPCPGR